MRVGEARYYLRWVTEHEENQTYGTISAFSDFQIGAVLGDGALRTLYEPLRY
jgi:hypothetical protein